MTTQELKTIHAVLSETDSYDIIMLKSIVNKISTPAWLFACRVRRNAGLKQHGLYNQCAYWHINEATYRAGCGQAPLKRYV